MQIQCVEFKWLEQINDTSFVSRQQTKHNMAIIKCRRTRGYKAETNE